MVKRLASHRGARRCRKVVNRNAAPRSGDRTQPLRTRRAAQRPPLLRARLPTGRRLACRRLVAKFETTPPRAHWKLERRLETTTEARFHFGTGPERQHADVAQATFQYGVEFPVVRPARGALSAGGPGPAGSLLVAIPKTHADDRAGVRSHSPQPRSHTIPPKRQNRHAHRVAIGDHDPQPHQAAPPPDRHREGLKPAAGADTAAQAVSAVSASLNRPALTPTPRPLSDSVPGPARRRHILDESKVSLRRIGTGPGRLTDYLSVFR
jgi:hypothetical protein